MTVPLRSILVLGLALSAPGLPLAAEEIRIGTGATTGIYYQVGRAICRMITEIDPVEGVTCEVESTPGSIYNLQNVRSGGLELGVVQSDWQHHAVNGTGPFAEAGADEGLRALFSVHGEPFTVVAREDSGIETFADLKGRRVNIGNPGSGQRGTMEVVMDAFGWTRDDFKLANELPASEHSLALCHDRVEAIVYTVGHPNPSISHATGLCNAKIVPVEGPQIQKLVETNPYYVEETIPGGIYSANPDPVKTFGVIATVVASSELDKALVSRIMESVVGNLEQFKKAHPAFGALEPGAMRKDGLSAPLHDGAAEFFRRHGLL